MLPELVVQGVVGVLGRWERRQELKVSKDMLQRLLLLECKVNLALLDLLRGKDAPAPALVAAVARSLSFDVFEQLFTRPAEGGGVLKDLAGDPAIGKAGGEGHLRNVYSRCMAIQEIGRLMEAAGPIPGVVPERRLKNLRRDMLRLVKALSP